MPSPSPAARLPVLIALAMLLALGSPPAARAKAKTAGASAADTDSLADLSLDALLDMPVTGASRFVQWRSQASSSVTVIGRTELLALGHQTLADVLTSVRGTRLANVDRVEFAAGQGSAVYGANALFGVVSVITREAARQAEGSASVAQGSTGERTLRVGMCLPVSGGGLQIAAAVR